MIDIACDDAEAFACAAWIKNGGSFEPFILVLVMANIIWGIVGTQDHICVWYTDTLFVYTLICVDRMTCLLTELDPDR
jgi:hypothetical protein